MATDPIEIADVLVAKTNQILEKMQHGWQELIRQPTTSVLPNSAQSSVTEAAMLEIRQELDSIRQLTARLSNRSQTQESDRSSGIPKSATRLAHTEPPAVEQSISNNLDRQPDSERLPLPSTGRTNRSRKSEWKKELTEKMNRLEQELDALRLEHTREIEQARVLRMDSNLFLDIVSSNQSSPVKNGNNKTFRVNPQQTFSRPNVLEAKKVVDERRKESRRNERVVGGKNAEVKEKLREAEKIMDRGFKTARELNGLVELMKRKPKKKTKKDAALQVSIEDKRSSAHSPCDNDSFMYGLAENVTSFLIQQQPEPVPASSRPPSSPPQPSHNAAHLVFQRQEEPPQKSRLAVQRLPENHIKGALVRQAMPSIHIDPSSYDAGHFKENTKVCVTRHPPSSIRTSSRLDSVSLRQSEPSRSVDVSRHVTKSNKTDMGVQAQLSDSSVNSEVETNLSKKLNAFTVMARRQNILRNDSGQTQTLKDLIRKVRQSGEMCGKYREKNLPVSLEQDKVLSIDEINERHSKSEEKKDMKKPVVVAEALRKESQSTISEAISKSVSNNEYKSDFEVESLDDDLSTSKKSPMPSSSKAHRSSLTSKTSLGDEAPLPIISKAPRSSISSPSSGKQTPMSKEDRSLEESLIEEQMKRLGMSPERVMTPRKKRPTEEGIQKVSQSPSRRRERRISKLSQSPSRRSARKRLEDDSSHKFYVKGNGKYFPVELPQNSQVQIIVPEIVVKLSEGANRPQAFPAIENSKVDQLIQTDAEDVDLDRTMDKLKDHFERTQQLLERLGGSSLDFMNGGFPGNSDQILGLLHKREPGPYTSTNKARSKGHQIQGNSQGEIKAGLQTAKRRRRIKIHQEPTTSSAAAFDPDDTETLSDGQLPNKNGRGKTKSNYAWQQQAGNQNPMMAQSQASFPTDLFAGQQINPANMTAAQLQQWQQWQTQYRAWQAQYGKTYEDSMRAMQHSQAAPPMPTQQQFSGQQQQQAMPPLPPEEKPPLPVQPVPPPDPKPPPPRNEPVEELSEAEKSFNIQFKEWEAQFEQWKKENVNHPDKTQYAEYEKKFQNWREEMLERREQLKRKRLASIAAAKQAAAPLPATAPEPPKPAPPVDPYNSEPLQFKGQPPRERTKTPEKRPITPEPIREQPSDVANLNNDQRMVVEQFNLPPELRQMMIRMMERWNQANIPPFQQSTAVQQLQWNFPNANFEQRMTMINFWTPPDNMLPPQPKKPEDEPPVEDDSNKPVFFTPTTNKKKKKALTSFDEDSRPGNFDNKPDNFDNGPGFGGPGNFNGAMGPNNMPMGNFQGPNNMMMMGGPNMGMGPMGNFQGPNMPMGNFPGQNMPMGNNMMMGNFQGPSMGNVDGRFMGPDNLNGPRSRRDSDGPRSRDGSMSRDRQRSRDRSMSRDGSISRDGSRSRGRGRQGSRDRSASRDGLKGRDGPMGRDGRSYDRSTGRDGPMRDFDSGNDRDGREREGPWNDNSNSNIDERRNFPIDDRGVDQGFGRGPQNEFGRPFNQDNFNDGRRNDGPAIRGLMDFDVNRPNNQNFEDSRDKPWEKYERDDYYDDPFAEPEEEPPRRFEPERGRNNLGPDREPFQDRSNSGFGPNLQSPDKFGGRPDNFGGRPDDFGGRRDDFAGRPDNFGGRPDQFGGRPDQFGGRPDNFGGRPDDFAGRPDNFGGRPDNFGGRPDDFAGRPDNWSTGPPPGGEPFRNPLGPEREPFDDRKPGPNPGLGQNFQPADNFGGRPDNWGAGPPQGNQMGPEREPFPNRSQGQIPGFEGNAPPNLPPPDNLNGPPDNRGVAPPPAPTAEPSQLAGFVGNILAKLGVVGNAGGGSAGDVLGSLLAGLAAQAPKAEPKVEPKPKAEPQWEPKVFDYATKPSMPKEDVSFEVVKDYGHGGMKPQSFDYGHGGGGSKSIDYGHGGSERSKKSFDYGHGGETSAIDYGHGGRNGSKEPASFRSRSRFSPEKETIAIDYGHGGRADSESNRGFGKFGKSDDADVARFDYSSGAPKTFDYGHAGADTERSKYSPARDRDRDRGGSDRSKGRDTDFGRDRDSNRDRDRDSNRDRDRDSNREKDRDSNRDKDRDSNRERDRDSNRDRDRDFNRGRDRGGNRDRDQDRGRDRNRDRDRNDRGRSPGRGRSPRRSRSPVRSKQDDSRKPADTRPETKVEPEVVKQLNSAAASSNITAIAVEDLISLPGRVSRPKQIVFIMRGASGSGKSFVTRLIKEKEMELGGAPRILSLDDYFMFDTEEEVNDPETGNKVKKKVMKYEYDGDMEEVYQAALIKAFKKTVSDGFFNFIIVDSVNKSLTEVDEMWSFAKTKGFQVYICEMDNDIAQCSKRNIHKRSEIDIETQTRGWEEAPQHYLRLDVRSLLQAEAIDEVEMEDAVDDEQQQASAESKTESKRKDDEDVPAVSHFLKSKWDDFETSGQKLDRLDGLKKKSQPTETTMEEYLTTDYLLPTERPNPSGKKRVRWADVEEQRTREKMRAIGFVVGQTNWNRMVDQGGESALTRTKYI